MTDGTDDTTATEGDAEDAGGAGAGAGRRVPTWLRRGATLLVVVVVAVLLAQGANRPPDPTFADEQAGAPDAAPDTGRRPLEGFEEVVFRIRSGEGDVADWCALLADTPETMNQGLMDQTDLRGYDGMLFRFDRPVETTFWMRNTLIPLSIAFFDADGRFVSSTDMEPCPDDVADCPFYGADAPFLYALEVPEGQLDELGIGPGSTLELPGGSCDGVTS